MRTRRMLLAIAASFIARGINLISTLFLVPICIHALGMEGYGRLSAIISFSLFFAFGDFGMGLTLMNRVSHAQGRGEPEEARRAISHAFAVTGVVAMAGSLLCFLILSAPSVFSASGAMSSYNGTLVIAVWLSVAGIPFNLATRILFGLQQGMAAQLWNAGGRVATVLAAFLASRLHAGEQAFALAIVGAPLLAMMLNTFIFFGFSRPDLRPRLSDCIGVRWKSEIFAGLQMFLLQFVTFFDVGFDAAIVNHFMGAEPAARLDIVTKLFVYVPALISVAIFPVWPALAEAYAGKDKRWRDAVIRAFNLAIPVIALLAGLVILWQYQWIIRVWAHVSLSVSPLITFSLLVYAVSNSIASFQSIELNARGIIGQQVSVIIFLGVLMLAGKLLAGAFHFLPGIPIVLAACSVLKLVIIHFRVVRASPSPVIS